MQAGLIGEEELKTVLNLEKLELEEAEQVCMYMCVCVFMCVCAPLCSCVGCGMLGLGSGLILRLVLLCLTCCAAPALHVVQENSHWHDTAVSGYQVSFAVSDLLAGSDIRG